jgi:hypothetical protein
MLPAFVQKAGERLCLFMCDFVGSHVASLSKPFMADIARVRLLAGVATLMGLKKEFLLTL